MLFIPGFGGKGPHFQTQHGASHSNRSKGTLVPSRSWGHCWQDFEHSSGRKLGRPVSPGTGEIRHWWQKEIILPAFTAYAWSVSSVLWQFLSLYLFCPWRNSLVPIDCIDILRTLDNLLSDASPVVMLTRWGWDASLKCRTEQFAPLAFFPFLPPQ